MNSFRRNLSVVLTLAAVGMAVPLVAFETPKGPADRAPRNDAPLAGLWKDRGDITSLDLVNGAGGKQHAPMGKFKFVKEDTEGSSPKFEVTDEQGVKWKGKLGEESKSEVAASRLLWAAGYFTDEDYYVPQLEVDSAPHLKRGHEFVEGNIIKGVRLKRNIPGQKKTGNWSWFKNPYVDTKEFGGLKVMMAFLNNWDLKEVNNALYAEKNGEARYTVSDLGASFGVTGNVATRSKSDPADYLSSKFVDKAAKDHVDFVLNSRPLAVTVFDVKNYSSRTHMEDIVKNIPIEDVRWLGKLLAPLTDEQIRDAFRGAGYSVGEVEEYARTVRARLMTLSNL